jgi:hypothetical protein
LPAAGLGRAPWQTEKWKDRRLVGLVCFYSILVE